MTEREFTDEDEVQDSYSYEDSEESKVPEIVMKRTHTLESPSNNSHLEESKSRQNSINSHRSQRQKSFDQGGAAKLTASEDLNKSMSKKIDEGKSSAMREDSDS
jgi:hypothetical protein